ncbi:MULTISPECIES: MEDS domain-containing protein [Bacillaceae]|uniref:histidine kinase n=1 Tax=Evansella alkalicola TaxID=745819 RepID=A0ABS6JQH0_9BACI|nr:MULTISPECIES: MEDS domain-containing protein [Bacillaceae]MBU9720797.1 MEDS domain-containing protein [Bacillus alkalicola]
MKIKMNTIPLTKKVNVKEGSHILYFFEKQEKYIDNAVSFILTAKTLGQKVILIESAENYKAILERLHLEMSPAELRENLFYISNYDFYEMYGDFRFNNVLTRFKNTVQPFYDKGVPVRIWGYVDWSEQHDIKEKLNTYESQCDLTVSDIGYMTVCTYNGKKVPSYILAEMLKTHEYFMTDDDLVQSSLYKYSEETIFPSLSTQRNIETEMDFYQQKLDFIHVVAHEVRNPLTVIQSYATLLKSTLTDDKVKNKLSLIEDYSIAIDHEINHIIQTEQMFSIDTFWRKTIININPVIDDVVSVMSAKARTQNITLIPSIDIPEKLIINGNLMGFKLIISNLLSNAIKYSEEGEEVTFKSYVDGRFFFIEIEDHGIGMSQEQLQKLFHKYQKINHEESGQGIGLYMVDKLVQHFEGDIVIDSEYGKGTIVTVKFPF